MPTQAIIRTGTWLVNFARQLTPLWSSSQGFSGAGCSTATWPHGGTVTTQPIHEHASDTSCGSAETGKKITIYVSLIASSCILVEMYFMQVCFHAWLSRMSRLLMKFAVVTPTALINEPAVCLNAHISNLWSNRVSGCLNNRVCAVRFMCTNGI